MARWGRLRHILGRGFPVCVSIVACRAPFPPPAHRTGRADFPHPALGQSSCFRPRVTTWKPFQVQQSKLTLQTTVGILAASLPSKLEFPTQPPTDPTAGVAMHDCKRRGIGSVTEVVGPPAQHLIDLVDQRFRPDERRQFAYQLIEPMANPKHLLAPVARRDRLRPFAVNTSDRTCTQGNRTIRQAGGRRAFSSR